MFSFADITAEIQKAADAAVQAAQSVAENAVEASSSVFSLDNLQDDSPQTTTATTAAKDKTEDDEWKWTDGNEGGGDANSSKQTSESKGENTAALESECKVLRQLVETLKLEVYSAKEENATLFNQVSTNSIKYGDMENALRECQMSLDEERKLSAAREATVIQLQAQLLDCDSKTKEKEVQLATSCANVDELTQQLARLKDNVGENCSKVGYLESQLATATDKIESLKSELEVSSARANEHETKARKASSECVAASEKADSLKGEVVRLTAQIEVLQNSSVDNKSGGGKKKDKFRDLLQASEETRKTLEQKMETLSASLRTTQDRVQELEKIDAAAKPLIEKLQKQVLEQSRDREEFEKRFREVEIALQDANAKISYQETVASTATAEAGRAKSKVVEMESEVKSLQKLVDSQVVGTDSLAKISEELAAKEKELSDIRSLLSRANADKDAVMKQWRDSQEAAKEARDEAERNINAVTAHLSAQLENAKNECLEKEKTIEETKEQCKQKVKDALIKFAESKKKLEEDIASLQSKDSESLSLRLKLEAVEKSLADQRKINSESSERLSESQRELTRTKGSVQDLNALIENLKRELSISVKQCETLKETLKEKESLHSISDAKLHEGEAKFLETISSLQAKLSNSEAERQLRESELLQQMETILKEERGKFLVLSSENEALVARLEAQSETSSALEEYKKRAQAALKKANNASATLASEKAEVVKSYQDCQLHLAEVEKKNLMLQDRAKIAASEVETMKASLVDVQSEVESLKCSLNDKTIGENKARSEWNKIQKDLEDQVEELKADLESAHSTISSLNLSIESSKSPSSFYLEAEKRFEKTEIATPARLERSIQPLATPAASQVGSVENSPVVPPTRAKLLSNRIGDMRERSFPLEIKESETVEFADGLQMKLRMPTSEQSLYINELYLQLEDLRKEVAVRNADVIAAQEDLAFEKEEKRQVKLRLDELLASVERSKTLQPGPETDLNTEYLKKCIYRFMASTEHSEKLRLFPVVSTILKFTPAEVKLIASVLENESNFSSEAAISSLSSLAQVSSSWTSMLFGGSDEIVATSSAISTTATNSRSGVQR